jgi:hypothetical protein
LASGVPSRAPHAVWKLLQPLFGFFPVQVGGTVNTSKAPPHGSCFNYFLVYSWSQLVAPWTAEPKVGNKGKRGATLGTALPKQINQLTSYTVMCSKQVLQPAVELPLQPGCPLQLGIS